MAVLFFDTGTPVGVRPSPEIRWTARVPGPHFSLPVQRKVAAGAVDKKHVSFGIAERKYGGLLNCCGGILGAFCRVRYTLEIIEGSPPQR